MTKKTEGRGADTCIILAAKGKPKVSAMCVWLWLSLHAFCLHAGVFDAPSQPLRNVDYGGFIQIHKALENIELGNGRSLDVGLVFSSDPRREPGILGEYWYIPLFESKVYKSDGLVVYWVRPDAGESVFEKRHEKNAGRQQPEIYTHRGGRWQLRILGNRTWVESPKDPDLKLEYLDGKLSRFCAGKGGDLFSVKRTSRGTIAALYNETKKRECLTVLTKGGQLLLLINDHEYALDFVQQKDVAESKKRLASLKYPDGRLERFEYTDAGEKKREILLPGFEVVKTKQPLPCRKMSISSENEDAESFWVQWCATTGMAVADSSVVYQVGNAQLDRYVADVKKDNLGDKEVRLSCNKPGEKITERWSYNASRMILKQQSLGSDDLITDYLVASRGNAYKNVRKREKQSKNPSGLGWLPPKVVENNFYDPQGRLVKQIDGKGNAVSFMYFTENGIDYTNKLINGALVHSTGIKDDQKVYELRQIEADIYESVFDQDSNQFIVTKNKKEIARYFAK